MRFFNLLLTFLLFTPSLGQTTVSALFAEVDRHFPDSLEKGVQLIEAFTLDELNIQQRKQFHDKASIFYSSIGNFSKEVYHLEQLTLLHTDQDSVHHVRQFLALAQLNSGDLNGSLETAKSSARHYAARNNLAGLGSAYNGMGNALQNLGYGDEAIEAFNRAISINEFLDRPEFVCKGYGNLAISYRIIGNMEKHFECCKKAYDIAIELQDTSEIMFYQMAYGSAFNTLNQPDSAIYYLEPLQNYFQTNFNAQILNAIYNDLGQAYSTLGDNDKAEEFYLKSIDLLRSGGFDFALPGTLANYSQVLFLKGEFEKGVEQAQQALPIAKRTGHLEVEMIVCVSLYQNFKGLGKADSALFYYERSKLLEDSLSNFEVQKNVLTDELNMEHSKEKRELQVESKARVDEQIGLKNIWISSSIILTLALIALFIVVRQRQKSLKIIASEKEYLDNLLHNLVHEFRTPLTLIKGPTEELMKSGNKENQDFLDIINRNSSTMLSLVNQILDYAKLKAGKLPIRTETQNVQLFFDDLIRSYQNHLSIRNQHLILSISSDFELIEIDADKLRKIMDNLISNAMKFSKEGITIELQVEVKDEILKVAVVDQGVGLSKKNQERIFEKFYQVDSSTTRKGEGTGLGLTFVQELIHLMNGSIEVKSQLGKGSTFIVSLPVATTKKQAANTRSNEVIGQAVLQTQEDRESEEDQPLILIIEDNTDMQQYLSTLLGDHQYRIELASNGQKGIDKAKELIPDLIISDVMMPLKDGYEVVQTLKSDPRTDHVPIIILTAKASFDSKLEGISTGADIYLSKPFSSEELILRVKNLLELQERIQRRFRGESITEQQIEKEEHPVLIQLRELIQANPDERFTAESLAEKVGFSRSQLHRKLKALTGMSTTTFVNEIRLQMAFTDLQTTTLNISEISYKYGFTDPAYFSTLFKKRFGKTPSEIR